MLLKDYKFIFVYKMSREAAGGVVITSAFDYLNPEINRPDIFEERTTLRTSISRRNKNSSATIAITIITVILSAFIFVTIVSWFTLLQTYYDSIVVNDIISTLVTSRFYFAVTATFITLIAFILFWYLYVNLRPDPKYEE
jgi:lysylphosphatidylglycerol synthetase-like protein (DUF2156 family)